MPERPTNFFIHWIRIFLLALIIFGIGLLLLQKWWVPKAAAMILGYQDPSLLPYLY